MRIYCWREAMKKEKYMGEKKKSMSRTHMSMCLALGQQRNQFV